MLSIGEYTLRTWGPAQTVKYIDTLELPCKRLASAPGSGRPCDDIRPGLYRSEVRRHVIFCRRVADDIVVVRILHQQMLPRLHSFSEGDVEID